MKHSEYLASRRRLLLAIRATGYLKGNYLYPTYPYTPGNELLWKSQLDAMSDHLEKLKQQGRTSSHD